MPTENRSSTIEQHDHIEGTIDMVSVPREEIEAACARFAKAQIFDFSRRVRAWLDKPAQHIHPEPIAWMVGTAFWWTKEEAERDAAATGLPVIPVGPMVDNGEVERLSAACAANIRARDEAIAEGRRYMGQASALDAALRELLADDIPLRVAAKIEAALSASAEPEATS